MAGSFLAAPTDIENQYTQLEILMMEELDSMFPLSPLRCIYRVPDRLRCACEVAYTPRVISIGPIHHGKEALKAMEVHKKRYLQCFMGRTNLSLKHYIRKIKDQEAKLRSCYTETIVLKSDEFVKIILVDAIFLIEFLFRYYLYPDLQDENDCICGKPRMVEDVRPDLQMLENQLPFFILEDLFDPDIFPVPSEYSDKLRIDGVERLSILFLSSSFLTDNESLYGMVNNWETIYSSGVEVQHFVDLLRKLCIAPLLKKQSDQCKFYTSPSIEELHLAGVKFKVGSTKNLFDIRFQDGILEIPKLQIGDSTELILRNLVAFEQCTFEEFYISDYISIMDELVDTSKDVRLLVEYKIFENYLGGGDVQLSTMINSLSTGIRFDPSNFHYGTLCEELNKFCSSKWHKSKANLRHNYFNTPWATISFFAASLLLILTAVQTICSIVSLH